MYANGRGDYTTLKEECSSTERIAISTEVNRKLVDTLIDPPVATRTQWSNLKRCINNNRTSNYEAPVKTVCR